VLTRILITGSAQGLGRAAATTLVGDGHQVVVHAATPTARLRRRTWSIAVRPWLWAIFASAAQTRHLADQVNQLGGWTPSSTTPVSTATAIANPSPEGHPRVLAVDTLAPYLLRGLIHRPDRLIYLTSDMHVAGDDSLNDLDWTSRRWHGTQAYCDSLSHDG
jgi:NAD(P)-dependent dehydrogenase (short-subunit alcohol dehydrogenase family)